MTGERMESRDSDAGKEEGYLSVRGKETSLNAKIGRRLGYGSRGNVYEAEVSLTEDELREHVWKFALKKFKAADGLSSEENAARAFKNYAYAKKAGLKVPMTYRLGEDKESVLMSLAGNPNTVFWSTDEWRFSLSPDKAERLEEIPNLVELCDGLFWQAFRAAGRGLSLHMDMPFLLVDSRTHRVDFVLGDLDNLVARQDSYSKVAAMNLREIVRCLHKFVVEAVSSEASPSMERIIHDQHIKAENKIELFAISRSSRP